MERKIYDENFISNEKIAESVAEELEKNEFFGMLKKSVEEGVEIAKKENALRYNQGKLELSQCAEETRAAIAAVFQKNSKENGGKYPKGNWKKGANYSTLIDCLERHFALFKSGVDIDEESGLPHLFLMAANIQMLIFTSIHYPQNDDRDKEFPLDLKEFTKYLKRD